MPAATISSTDTTGSGIKAVSKGVQAMDALAATKPMLKSFAKAAGGLLKRLPIIGAAVTLGTVAYEAGSDIKHGEFSRAGAAVVAGGAEALGNTVGFGVGDAAREGVRAVMPDSAKPDKSGLRQLGESAIKMVNEKTAARQRSRPFMTPSGM